MMHVKPVEDALNVEGIQCFPNTEPPRISTELFGIDLIKIFWISLGFVLLTVIIVGGVSKIKKCFV